MPATPHRQQCVRRSYRHSPFVIRDVGCGTVQIASIRSLQSPVCMLTFQRTATLIDNVMPIMCRSRLPGRGVEVDG